MRNVYDKLIRDNIPAIIEQRGGTCGVEIMPEAAYRAALRSKLVEEAHEVVAAATDDELVTELADVCEVLEALMAAHNIAPEQVQAVHRQRRRERGGFTRRLRLLWTQ